MNPPNPNQTSPTSQNSFTGTPGEWPVNGGHETVSALNVRTDTSMHLLAHYPLENLYMDLNSPVLGVMDLGADEGRVFFVAVDAEPTDVMPPKGGWRSHLGEFGTVDGQPVTGGVVAVLRRPGADRDYYSDLLAGPETGTDFAGVIAGTYGTPFYQWGDAKKAHSDDPSVRKPSARYVRPSDVEEGHAIVSVRRTLTGGIEFKGGDAEGLPLTVKSTDEL